MLSDGGLHLQAGSNLSFSPRDAMRKRAAQSLLSPGVCPPVTLVYQGLGKGFFVSVRTSANDWRTSAVWERDKLFFCQNL